MNGTDLNIKVGGESCVYPSWKSESIKLPERSKFFPLVPACLGTCEVESLVSYISRLAYEHKISPLSMLNGEVLKVAGFKNIKLDVNSSGVLRNMHGTGYLSEALVQNLTKGTFNSNIIYTTILSWKNKIDDRKLFNSKRFWCRQCFSDQMQIYGFNFEKLIWTFKDSERCSVHKKLLENKCPSCNRLLKPFSSKFRPGFCSNCFRWLGDKNKASQGSVESTDKVYETSLEMMIAKSSQEKLLAFPFRFSSNLSQAIKQCSYSDHKEFSREIYMWQETLQYLLEEKTLPSWEQLITISKALKVSVLKLCISNDFIVPGIDLKYLNSIKSLQNNIKDLSEMMNPSDTKLPEILEILMLENPPPTFSQIRERIGWAATERFKLNYPEFYQKIIKKHQDYRKKRILLSDDFIEDFLVKASIEELPRSLESILNELNCKNNAYIYYEKFPHLFLIIAIRKFNAINQVKRLQNIERSYIDLANWNLKEALQKLPAIVKYPINILKKYFPKLYELLIVKMKKRIKKYPIVNIEL